jgi:4-amino-4-deoxy-L-arabinose transferase-like glycosyltransferase
MVLTVLAAVLWLLWYAHLTGWPSKLAHNVLKLIPGYQPELHVAALLVALCATAGWFWLVHWRISRRPTVLWRAVVLSSGGLILIWILLTTLFLPHMNYSKSYATVARQAAAVLPAGTDCVDTNMGTPQRASFAYYGGLPFQGGEERDCKVMLLQVSIKGKLQPPAPGPQWQLLWEGRRPADKVERFRLYQRKP